MYTYLEIKLLLGSIRAVPKYEKEFEFHNFTCIFHADLLDAIKIASCKIVFGRFPNVGENSFEIFLVSLYVRLCYAVHNNKKELAEMPVT